LRFSKDLDLCWRLSQAFQAAGGFGTPVSCYESAARCRDSPSLFYAAHSFGEQPFMSASTSSVTLAPDTVTPGPDALDLAALLCSRVCHDLISPVGAIVNGLEVLDDAKNADDRDFALDLIRKSARGASAKLQFCRLAFGAAGSAGAQIDTGDAEKMARGFMEDEKTKIAWNLARTLQPKNRVKLLLNMLIIAQQTIPRGGTLTVDALGQGDSAGFRVRAAGLNARLPQNIADQLAGLHQGPVDAHAVQPYYTRLLAQACALKPSLVMDGDGILISAA
jgi:histidine phosphotransferase ChpT